MRRVTGLEVIWFFFLAILLSGCVAPGDFDNEVNEPETPQRSFDDPVAETEELETDPSTETPVPRGALTFLDPLPSETVAGDKWPVFTVGVPPGEDGSSVRVSLSAVGGGAELVGERVVASEDGLAKFSNLTYLVAEDILVQAHAENADIDGATTPKIHVRPGPVKHLIAEAGSVPADNVTPLGITILLTDAHGNPVPNETVHVDRTEGAPVDGIQQGDVQTTGPEGRTEFTATGVVAGVSVVYFTDANGNKADVTATFLPGPPVELQTEEKHHAAGTDEQHLQVVLIDAQGNPVPGKDILVMETDDLGGMGASATTDEEGVAVFHFMEVRAGTYEPVLALGDDADVRVLSRVTITPGGPYAVMEVGGGSQTGGVLETLGDPHTVRVVDTYGNSVEDHPVKFSIYGTPEGAVGQGLGDSSMPSKTVHSGLDGTASVSFQQGNATGNYTVHAMSSGDDTPLDGAPVVFRSEAKPGPATAFTVVCPQLVAVGVPFTCTVDAVDAHGNRNTEYDGAIVITTDNDPAPDGTLPVVPSERSFTPGDRGRIVLEDAFTLFSSGTGSVIKTRDVQDPEVQGTSRPISVDPGAVKNYSFSRQPSDTVAGATLDPPPQVSFLDEYGNVATDANLPVTLALDPHAFHDGRSQHTIDSHDGVASFPDLAITTAATGYTLTATSGPHASIVSLPFEVRPASPTGLQAHEVSKTAGEENREVLLTLNDPYGNAVKGETIIVQEPDGLGGWAPGDEATTDPGGQAVFPFTETTADTYEPTFILSADDNVQATATVVVHPAAAEGLDIEAVQVAAGEGDQVVVGFATDAFGNPVPDKIVEVVSPDGLSIVDADSTTDLQGEARFRFDETVAGEYHPEFQVRGSSVAAVAEVLVLPASPTRLAFLHPPTDEAVAGEPWEVFRVAVEDDYGNHVDTADGILVTVSAVDAEGELEGESTVLTQQGVAIFHDVRHTVAETLHVESEEDEGLLESARSGPVRILPAGADSVEVAVTQEEAVADGEEKVAFVVTVRDTYDNPVPSVQVCIEDEDGIPVTWDYSCTGSDAEGQAGFQARSTRAGTVSVTFMEPSGEQDVATASFRPGALAQVQIHNAGGGNGNPVESIILNEGERRELYAAGYDQHSNYIDDVEVEWSVDAAETAAVDPPVGAMTSLQGVEAGEAMVTAEHPDGFVTSDTVPLEVVHPSAIMLLPNFIEWDRTHLDILIVPPAHGPLVESGYILPYGVDGGGPKGVYLEATLHVLEDWAFALQQASLDHPEIAWIEGLSWTVHVVAEDNLTPQDITDADIVKIYTETTWPFLGAAMNTNQSPGCIAYSTMWRPVTAMSYMEMYDLAGHELGHCLGPSHPENDPEGLDIMSQGGHRQNVFRCPSNLDALAVAAAFSQAFGAETGPEPRANVKLPKSEWKRYCGPHTQPPELDPVLDTTVPSLPVHPPQDDAGSGLDAPDGPRPDIWVQPNVVYHGNLTGILGGDYEDWYAVEGTAGDTLYLMGLDRARYCISSIHTADGSRIDGGNDAAISSACTGLHEAVLPEDGTYYLRFSHWGMLEHLPQHYRFSFAFNEHPSDPYLQSQL